MLYNDKIVQPKPITKDELNRMQLDARRVLGQAMAKDGSYLEPPQESSNTWKWAQGVLELNWPVASIGIKYVNLNELRPLPSLPPRPQYFSHSTWLPLRNEIDALPVWEHLDGRELRIIRMHSVTTAFVVEIKYGGLWTSKVDIDDLYPVRNLKIACSPIAMSS